ncbi:MAG: alkaline shock response membrane anchor protein AmaP [Oscillospiraceae bacterium]
MKVFVRIVGFLLVLALLAGLVAMLSVFTDIPWLSAFVQGLIVRWPWLNLAFSIVLLCCITAGVLALILIVSVPSKHKLFVVGRDAGKIEITRQSIESAAGASLGGIREVKRYHVQAKGDMRPGKLKLDVQAEPRDGSVNLDAMGRAVQQKLAADLADCLAMDPRHIKVRVQPVHPSAEARRQHARVPRVV